MIEVEAKIKISNPVKFRKKVKNLAKYKGTKKKSDIYYTHEKINKYTNRRIRIRKIKNRYEINIKKDLSYKKNIHAKKEVELILNKKQFVSFKEIIENQGYKPWIKKEKTTETYQIKKNFNIELNNVKSLGWFAEIEYLSTPGSVAKARSEVSSVLKKLGIDKKKIIKSGYTKLLWNKRKRGF